MEGFFMQLATMETRDQPSAGARHFAGRARLTVSFDLGCPLGAREIASFRRLDQGAFIHFEDISRSGSVCLIDHAQMLARSRRRSPTSVTGRVNQMVSFGCLTVARPPLAARPSAGNRRDVPMGLQPQSLKMLSMGGQLTFAGRSMSKGKRDFNPGRDR
jgi:hypothetical protein